MLQTKISFEESQIEFLDRYSELGYKDKSSMVRSAVETFRKIIENRKLAESAKLYAELYGEDEELQNLAEEGFEEWPK